MADWQSDKLSTGSRVQSFPRTSSTNLPVLLLNYSNSSCNGQEPGSLLHGAMDERSLKRDLRTRGGCPGGWGEEGGPWVSVYPLSYLRYTLLFLPNP